MTTKKYQGLFLGNSVWTGMMKEEYDGHNITYFIRRKRWLFFEQWIPVLTDCSVFMKKRNEVPVYDAGNHRTTERMVTIFPFGLGDMKTIERLQIVADNERELQTTITQRDFLYNALMDAKSKFESLATEDSVKSYMKDWFDTIDKDFKTAEVDKLKNAMQKMRPQRR